MDTIVIVGAGPAGVKAATQLLEKSEQVQVKIFNGERVLPYNRARLSYYLAGEIGLNELENRLPESDARLHAFDAVISGRSTRTPKRSQTNMVMCMNMTN